MNGEIVFDFEPWKHDTEHEWSTLTGDQEQAVMRLVRLSVAGPMHHAQVIGMEASDVQSRGTVETADKGVRRIRVGWFMVPEPVIGDDSYRSMWVMLHG